MPRKPGVQAARSEQTRRRILDAAEETLARSGFAGTRVDEIAERAGIRRASLFYYFKDKREIYETVLAGIFASLVERMAPVFRAAPDEAQIEPAVGEFFDFLTERPAVARILLRELAEHEAGAPSPLADEVRPIMESVRALLAGAEREGLVEPVDPLHLVLTVAGAALLFATGTPLLGGSNADPRAELVRIVRRLLGLESD